MLWMTKTKNTSTHTYVYTIYIYIYNLFREIYQDNNSNNNHDNEYPKLSLGFCFWYGWSKIVTVVKKLFHSFRSFIANFREIFLDWIWMRIHLIVQLYSNDNDNNDGDDNDMHFITVKAMCPEAKQRCRHEPSKRLIP